MRSVDLSFKDALLFSEEGEFKAFARACGFLVSPENPAKLIKNNELNERQKIESFAKYH